MASDAAASTPRASTEPSKPSEAGSQGSQVTRSLSVGVASSSSGGCAVQPKPSDCTIEVLASSWSASLAVEADSNRSVFKGNPKSVIDNEASPLHPAFKEGITAVLKPKPAIGQAQATPWLSLKLAQETLKVTRVDAYIDIEIADQTGLHCGGLVLGGQVLAGVDSHSLKPLGEFTLTTGSKGWTKLWFSSIDDAPPDDVAMLKLEFGCDEGSANEKARTNAAVPIRLKVVAVRVGGSDKTADAPLPETLSESIDLGRQALGTFRVLCRRCFQPTSDARAIEADGGRASDMAPQLLPDVSQIVISQVRLM